MVSDTQAMRFPWTSFFQSGHFFKEHLIQTNCHSWKALLLQISRLPGNIAKSETISQELVIPKYSWHKKLVAKTPVFVSRIASFCSFRMVVMFMVNGGSHTQRNSNWLNSKYLNMKGNDATQTFQAYGITWFSHLGLANQHMKFEVFTHHAFQSYEKRLQTDMNY